MELVLTVILVSLLVLLFGSGLGLSLELRNQAEAIVRGKEVRTTVIADGFYKAGNQALWFAVLALVCLVLFLVVLIAF